MPYEGEVITGRKAVMEELAKYKSLEVEVPEHVMQNVVQLRWIHSSFSDPGDDWNRADLHGADGTLLHSVVIPGY